MAARITERWIALIAIFVMLMAPFAYAARHEVVLNIQGMDCSICALAVKKSLEGVKGVGAVKVSLGQNKAWVTTDKSVPDSALIDAVKKAGFKASISGTDK
ncbi:MAG: heavy metal-associated domain-containing protein [Nitrospiraceae bacterium]|nr:heavy metal-associated domain-containing protein [Nitrospiraceae bacterium]